MPKDHISTSPTRIMRKGHFHCVFLSSAPCRSSLFPLSCPPTVHLCTRPPNLSVCKPADGHPFGLECSTKDDCSYRVVELASKSLYQEESSWHTPHTAVQMNPALQTCNDLGRNYLSSCIHQCFSPYTDASQLFIHSLAEGITLHVKYSMVDADKI